MTTLDDIDKKIIQLLSINAKQSIKEIADKVSISKTPVYERIKKLERSGIIEKYIAVVDKKKLVDGMYVFCSVSLNEQKLEEIEIFKTEIKKIPEVLECYLMGGGITDFLLKVLVKNLDDYHQFSSGKLAALKNVSQIRSTFVLDVVKKDK